MVDDDSKDSAGGNSETEYGLVDRLADRTARLAVVGLGYVGTPVACSFADVGFPVLGIDIDATKVDAINSGLLPIEGAEPGLAELLAAVVERGAFRASADFGALEGVDVVLVAVETPVDESNLPRYEALKAALSSVGPQLWPGSLVIIESTLAPGTMERVVAPLLTKTSGLAVGRDLLLAHCPERVMPGRLLENLSKMSRVVGGTTPDAADAAVALYKHVVGGDLDRTDALTAEIVKAGENTYRDVQIAFANEMALLCESLGADVWQVRELLNKSPGRNMLLPGAGVGGHCIPKDPWLLIAHAGEGFEARLVPAARAVNDGMPHQLASAVLGALSASGLEHDAARVAVLGYAYLGDSDDDRNSPSATLIGDLEAVGVTVSVHDPWVPAYKDIELPDAVAGADAIVVMVDHSVYREIDLAALRSEVRAALLFDGRRVFEPGAAADAGWDVRTLGVG